MKVIFTMVRVLTRSVAFLVFVAMLGLLITSHTFEPIAALTEKWISSALGVSAATTISKTRKLKVENEALKKEKLSLKKSLSDLKMENSSLKKKQTVTFRGEKTTVREAAKKVSLNVRARTKKVAAANLASAGGESIPFYGIAVIAAATAYELKVSCDTMVDMHELDLALNPESANEEGRDFVCGLKVPTRQELWSMVRNSPQATWDAAVGAYDSSSEWVAGLEAPDFSGAWSRMVKWASSWLE